MNSIEVGSRSKSTRYESLTHWRGIACLLVIAFHSTHFAIDPIQDSKSWVAGLVRLTSAGWLGVPIFFVISGYCITASTENSATRGILFTSYLKKRFCRIYPPYWAALVIYILFAVLMHRYFPFTTTDATRLPHPYNLDAAQWMGNISLTEIWRQRVFGGGDVLLMLPVSWTLCYEEQFYLLCGGLLIVCPRKLWVGILFITMMTILNTINLNIGVVRAANIDLNSFQIKIHGCFICGMWMDFAAGCAVYFATQTTRMAIRKGILLGLLAAGAAYGAIHFTKHSSFVAAPNTYRICASLFAVALILMHRWDIEICSIRFLDALRWCGTRCYSLYLIHFPITLFLSKTFEHKNWLSPEATLFVLLPASFGISLIAGELFYRNIESHFQNSRY